MTPAVRTRGTGSLESPPPGALRLGCGCLHRRAHMRTPLHTVSAVRPFSGPTSWIPRPEEAVRWEKHWPRQGGPTANTMGRAWGSREWAGTRPAPGAGRQCAASDGEIAQPAWQRGSPRLPVAASNTRLSTSLPANPEHPPERTFFHFAMRAASAYFSRKQNSYSSREMRFLR